MYRMMESHVCSLFARQDLTEIDSILSPWVSEVVAELHGRDTHQEFGSISLGLRDCIFNTSWVL